MQSARCNPGRACISTVPAPCFPSVSNPPLSDESLPWEQLVAKAVHDMRSPLSTINTTLAVLRMALHDPAKAEKLVGIIERQSADLTEQLNRLVTDPASYARKQEQA